MEQGDYVGGRTPYKDLTDEMLRALISRGDKAAETQLFRNHLIKEYGKEIVENREPAETVSEEVLLVRILQGDETAEAELRRRHELK